MTLVEKKLQWSGYKQWLQVGGGAFQLEDGGCIQETLRRYTINIDLPYL